MSKGFGIKSSVLRECFKLEAFWCNHHDHGNV